MSNGAAARLGHEPVHRADEVVGAKWLGEEMVGLDLMFGECLGLRGAAEKKRLEARKLRPHLVDEVEAVDVANLEVGHKNHRGRSGGEQRLAGGQTLMEQLGLVTGTSDKLPRDLAEKLVVVHDEHERAIRWRRLGLVGTHGFLGG